jgi:hypothetical protein
MICPLGASTNPRAMANPSCKPPAARLRDLSLVMHTEQISWVV